MTITCIASLLLTGCSIHSGKVETGKPLNKASIDKIVNGETTGGEILAYFGAPTKTSRLGKEELFVYRHCLTASSHFSTAGLGSSKSQDRCDELSVVLDADGIVKSHGFVPAPE